MSRPLRCRRSVLVLAVLAAVVALLPAAPTEGEAPPPRAYTWTTVDGVEVAAERGWVEVPEDRHDPESRTLQLAWVRLPSTAAEPGFPIVYLAGGPGASGIDSARTARADLLSELRRLGDVILLDQRGTGDSRPAVVCGRSWEHPRDEPLSEEAALEAVVDAARICADQLAKRGVPLSSYSVLDIADDVEAVRQALGVERIRLLATSFGTRLALEVLRRHGDSVDAAALLGVVGPDHVVKSPAAVDGILARVESGGGSSVTADLHRLLDRVREAPVEARAMDVLTGKPVTLRLSAFDLRRSLLHHLDTAADLDHLRELVADMKRGDFDPVAEVALRQRKSWLGHVMPYAVTCGAGASEERRRRVAREVPESIFGEVLQFGFPRICGALGVDPLPAVVRQPVRSDVPVLLVSGTLDTRTPVANAEKVLEGLSAAAHLVVEGAGHGDDLFVSTPELADRVAAFFRERAAASDTLAAHPPWRRVPAPPDTLVQAVTETLHGVEVVDPYRWLEDPGTPETRIWVRGQNRYTDRVVDVLPGRQGLRSRLGELFSGPGIGRPIVRAGRIVYRRAGGAGELPRLVVQDGEGQERVVVDPAALAAAEDIPAGSLNVDLLDVSSDGEMLAYSVQRDGAEEVAVRFHHLEDGPLPDELPVGRYFGVTFAPDGEGVYYARELDSGEGSRYRYHRFGSEPAAAPTLFGEAYGPASIVWGNLSDDGRHLVLHGVSGTQRQIDVFLDRVEPDGSSTGHDVATRKEVVSGIDATFYAGVLGNRLVIHTDWEAPRGRVFTAPLDYPGRESWREIIPEDSRAVIRTVYGAGGHLLVETLEGVESRLTIYDLEGREVGKVSLPETGNVLGMSGSWEDDHVYLTFSSFHLPPTVYRYDVATRELEPWPGEAATVLDPEDYEVRQASVKSRDGTRVPVFLVHRKGLERDRSHPTLVTAYGGFGTSMTPSYLPEAALWVERGGVWVVAQVRGGGELGREWHQAAVRENKQRSIDDLLDTLEWLVEEGYTRPERLALWGHSNGGLLVAAAMTQEPERMAAVVSSHPLLDMLRYNKFLAARFWLPEYGSPDRADAFPHLRAYSPYHRVEAGRRYPALFLVTSYGDTQVAALHARKMAARLQAATTEPGENPERPVVLRHLYDSGHGGEGVTADERIDELVDVLSFLDWQLGFALDRR